MDVRGAVYAVLRGPAGKAEETLSALRKGGIHVDRSWRGTDVIEAFFLGGDERPSPHFMDTCLSRVQQAAAGTEFAVEESGTMDGHLVERRFVFDVTTGELVGAFLDTGVEPEVREETLTELARERGVRTIDLELRAESDGHPAEAAPGMPTAGPDERVGRDTEPPPPAVPPVRQD